MAAAEAEEGRFEKRRAAARTNLRAVLIEVDEVGTVALRVGRRVGRLVGREVHES